MRHKYHPNNVGFTLVELLIVVVILALLTAIVVPQFSSSAGDARLATLDTNLKAVRAAIDLYYLQHQHYPGAVKSKGVCTKGTNQEANTSGEEAFVAHLMLYSTLTGIACSQSDGKAGGPIKFGPYLKMIPKNPFTGDNQVKVIAAGDLVLTGTGTDKDGGWLYDYITGAFIADQPSYGNR